MAAGDNHFDIWVSIFHSKQYISTRHFRQTQIEQDDIDRILVALIRFYSHLPVGSLQDSVSLFYEYFPQRMKHHLFIFYDKNCRSAVGCHRWLRVDFGNRLLESGVGTLGRKV